MCKEKLLLILIFTRERLWNIRAVLKIFLTLLKIIFDSFLYVMFFLKVFNIAEKKDVPFWFKDLEELFFCM